MKYLITICLLFLLTACSGTYHYYWDSIKTASEQNKDSQLSAAQIRDSNVDYLQVKNFNDVKIVLALAFIDAKQRTWVGADRSSITTSNDRIIRSDIGNSDLLHIDNLTKDPLSNGLGKLANSDWLFVSDYETGEYGMEYQAVFSLIEQTNISFLGYSLETVHFVETVKATNSDTKYQNHYWFNSDNGELVKSIQTIHNSNPPLEMIYASRIIRYLDAKN